MFAKSISKEQLNQLPIRSFEGNIHLIDSPAKVSAAIKLLNQKQLLGFDTETKPAFKKGEKHQVALLQLADEEDAFLFRLNKIGVPSELQTILSDKRILKIGAAVKDDIKAIYNLHCSPPAGFVDLQTLVKDFGIESVSLQKMTAIVLQFKISKRQQISNWEADKLSEAQLRYAATDSWVGFKIFSTMRKVFGSRFQFHTQAAE